MYFRRSVGRLAHITLGIVDKPGSLRAVLAALPEGGVDLLMVNVSNQTGERVAEGHIFAEIAPLVAPGELEQLLEKIPEVHHVRIQWDVQGRLIDDSYPLRLAELDRALLLSARSFAEACNRMRDTMGPGGAVLLYEFGRQLGREFALYALRVLGRDFVRSNLAYSSRLLSSMGWGWVELRDVDWVAGRVTLRVHESFECYRAEPGMGPRSQFVRGVLAGAYSALVEAPMSCDEVACRAQGNSECEFVLERLPPKSTEAPILPG